MTQTEQIMGSTEPIRINVKDLETCRVILDEDRQETVFNHDDQWPLVPVPTGGRKCVILLALSVYPGRFGTAPINMRKNDYAVAGRTEKEYSGRYQMEVVPKYIMNELKDSSIKDVEFIILETNEVHTPQDHVVMMDNRCCEADMTDDDHINPTEAEYFIYRTRRYIDMELAGKIDKDHVRFVEYYLSDQPRKDMPNLMDLVRRETGSGSAADIYIDIHGGPRGTQQLLINLLSILGEEGVEIDPDHIFTVDGNGAPITVAGESFRVNDFVSGIHEFTNYGRMNSLNAFYENRDYKPGELLEAMNAVSYAIQACDMAEFETVLPDLAAALTDFKRTGNKEDYLYTFLDLLVRGYDPLIKSDGDAFYADTDPRKEITWCKTKGLYQQMLTLCEASIPRFLSTYPVDRPIIQYDPDLVTLADEKRKYYELYNYMFNRVINAIAKEDQPTDGWYRALTDGYAARFQMRLGHSDTLMDLLKMHFELKELRNHSNHGSLSGNHTGDQPDEGGDKQSDAQKERHGLAAEQYLNDLVQNYLDYIEDLIKMQTDQTFHPGEQRSIKVKKDPLADKVSRLSQYLKKADRLQETYANTIDNVKLRNLYRLICTAAGYDEPEQRRAAIQEMDQSTVMEIYRNWLRLDGNTMDYNTWLLEMFLKDSDKKSFSKKASESLAGCCKSMRFMYSLVDNAQR